MSTLRGIFFVACLLIATAAAAQNDPLRRRAYLGSFNVSIVPLVLDWMKGVLSSAETSARLTG